MSKNRKMIQQEAARIILNKRLDGLGVFGAQFTVSWGGELYRGKKEYGET